MNIKIENRATIKLPPGTIETIEDILKSIPQGHLRGLSKIVLVDLITSDNRTPIPADVQLPGIYHPRMGNIQAWCEVAMKTILPQANFIKRMTGRLNIKSNLAGVVFSLQAQHYCLTISHGIKKNNLEAAVRSNTEKYYETWREKQTGLRAKLFKPMRPYLDRWARNLSRKYEEEQRKKSV
jgi:hypothetical protein